MRSLIRSLGVLAAGVVIASTSGCMTITQPSVEDVKSIRIIEKPDLQTLDIYGHVLVDWTAAEYGQRDAEESAIEALKAQALRLYPETTLLFYLDLRKSDNSRTYQASAIAGRRKGT